MHLPLGRLRGDDVLQEGHKLFTGMSRRRLPDHFACSRIQRRIQRQSAMAVVFKAMSFGPSWRKRQALVQSVQCLNRALFVHTKHRRVLRRIQVESNDGCRRPRLELRIVRGNVAFQPMRLELGLVPDPRDQILAHLHHRSHLSQRPMRRSIGWSLSSSVQHFSSQRCRQFARRLTRVKS